MRDNNKTAVGYRETNGLECDSPIHICKVPLIGNTATKRGAAAHKAAQNKMDKQPKLVSTRHG